jgi:hypothetical protein
MNNLQRSRRRRRDAGMAQVGRWTRRSVATGVVLSGVLGAGLAHLLPGQAAVERHTSPPATTPQPQPDTEAQTPGEPRHPAPGTEPSARRPKHHYSLTPPSAAPLPTQSSTHVTSGGS